VEVLRTYLSIAIFAGETDYLLQIVYCVWILFELVFLYLFIVETKGRSLEETAVLFDGEDAEDVIVAAGAHEVREDKGKTSPSSEKPPV
jgi:hypothetical protein